MSRNDPPASGRRGAFGRRMATIGVAATAALVTAGVATAGAAGITTTTNANGSQTIKGDITSGSIHVSVDATKTADGKTSGSFESNGALARVIGLPDLVPFELKGPVTCLNVNKSGEGGLFYPLTKSNPDLLRALNLGVYVTFRADKRGGSGQMGFVPEPVALQPILGCGPGAATFLTLSSGDLTLGSGS